MRAYDAAEEETLRTRKFLKDWAGEQFLGEAQYHRLEQETASGLRTTNLFLRIVLFLFTLVIVGAAAGLFFAVFLERESSQTESVFLIAFAAVSYAAAEAAVSQARLYRYGIEEALLLCSIGFLSVGIGAGVSAAGYSGYTHRAEFLAGAAGAILSIWIWHRFGLPYVFVAAMILATLVPGTWTSSRSTQHAIVALFYLAGLAVVAAVRTRHRFDYLGDAYSLVEAFLWLGIYLALNLQLSSLDQLSKLWIGLGAATEFSRPFYWTTFVLIWCLPPIMLTRGIRQKDRLVLAAGLITTVLTFVTNKPYLGWPRHTWDPMLLGILLIAVALVVRRWLERGTGGVRCGFTAERLSGIYKQWVDAGSAAFGLVAPQAITPAPQESNPEFRFGGGDSGGGGASSGF